jgi:hypothetical protein
MTSKHNILGAAGLRDPIADQDRHLARRVNHQKVESVLPWTLFHKLYSKFLLAQQ